MAGIKAQYNKLSLTVKLFVFCALAGLIPLCVAFTASYQRMRTTYYENHIDMAGQRYEQVLSALTDRLTRVYSISIAISTNISINKSLRDLRSAQSFEDYFAEYERIKTYLHYLDYAFEYDNVSFYVNSVLDTDQSLESFFRTLDSPGGAAIASEMLKNSNKATWIPVKSSQTYLQGDYSVLARYIVNMENHLDDLAIVVIYVNNNIILDTFGAAMPGQLLYLKTASGDIIACNDEEAYGLIPDVKELEEQPVGARARLNIGNSQYLAMSDAIPGMNLRLYSFVPVYVAEQYAASGGANIFLLFACSIVLMLLSIFIIIKSVLRRIILLSEKVKGGSMEALDIPYQKDEIGELVNNYNSMVERIDSLLQNQYILGQENMKEQLKSLQAHINPHVLYNTLDMIRWMAEKNETNNIKETVLALAKYYKLMLNKGEDLLTIDEELQMISAYVLIQQKRFKGRIKLEVDTEDSIKQYLIPKMTLQPLVENAIIHGILEKNTGRGIITVVGREEGDKIFISITDDGVGMLPERDINKGSKYGMRNIEKRLALLYNMDNCLSFRSTVGIGTSVNITIGKIK